MKKTISIAAVAITLTACHSTPTAAPANTDSTTVKSIDSIKVDSTITKKDTITKVHIIDTL